MENDFQHQIRHVRVLGHASRGNQSTSGIPKTNQQNLRFISRHTLNSISGRWLHRLRQAGITPKGWGGNPLRYWKASNQIQPSIWEFHQHETQYLGFIITNEGVKVDPIKTAARLESNHPRAKKRTLSSWGYASSTEHWSMDSADQQNRYTNISYRDPLLDKDPAQWQEVTPLFQ